MTEAKRPVKIVQEFFGMTAKEMMGEWSANAKIPLTKQDKDDLLNGITSGSLTY